MEAIFLQTKLMLVLELNVQNIIQINSRPKQNCRIVYCSLKNMLHRIGVLGDTKYQNLIIFFFKIGEYIDSKKILLNLFGIEVFRIERILTKTFLIKTISILSIHLHYLKNTLDK